LVTLLRSDKGFESNGCARWTSNLARITKSKTRFGQGAFIVGTDIAPGTYRSRLIVTIVRLFKAAKKKQDAEAFGMVSSPCSRPG
jgi:hypothetical protein